jgi:tripartite-type tricarboxylate transporter receptor subunit TctC
VIARLNAALTATLGEPAPRQRIQVRREGSGGGTPERLAQALAEDDARWGHVARANNIRAEG